MSGVRLQKHVREALERLPGWSVVGMTGGGHYRLQHAPTGARMVVASSPGKTHAMRDAVRQGRMLERKAK